MSVPPREVAPAANEPPATTGESVLRGGAWSTATRLVPQLYVLGVSVAAARFLGPEEFGRQSFIAFVELSLILLLTGGLTNAAMRFVGESLGRGRPEAVGRLVAWAWAVEGVAAALGGGVLLAVALGGAEPGAAWVLAGAACAIGILHAVPSALLLGAQRWRDASVVGLVTGAYSTAATVIVLALGGGITGMFAVEAATSALNLLWTGWLARRALAQVLPHGRGSLQAEEWRELRARTLRFTLLASYGTLLLLVVWRRSEFVFLETYSTETQIALYSIAFALMTALVQLPEALAAVFLPAVATLFGAGETERIRAGFSRALRLLLLLALPVVAGALALGPALVRLVYGEEFRDAGPILLVLLAVFPLIPLMQVSKSLLAGLGRLRFLLGAETGAAALNIALSFALVPGHGALGAAIANVVAQAAASLVIFLHALRAVGDVRWEPLSLWRAGAASAATGLAAWAVVELVGGPAGLVLGLLAGVALFAALAVALRILPAQDAAWLEEAAGSRLGGLVGAVCRHCA